MTSAIHAVSDQLTLAHDPFALPCYLAVDNVGPFVGSDCTRYGDDLPPGAQLISTEIASALLQVGVRDFTCPF